MKKILLALMVLMVLGSVNLITLSTPTLNVSDSKYYIMRFAMLIFAGVMLFKKDKWLLAWYLWMVLCLYVMDNKICAQRMYVLFFVLLFYQMIRDKLNGENAAMILDGIAIIGLVHCAFIIMQSRGFWHIYKVMPRYVNSGMWPGVTSDTNSAGSLLAICMPAFLRKRWFWGLIPLAIGFYLSEALGGVMACFVGLAAYSYYHFKSKTSIVVILVIISLLFGFYMVKKEPGRLKGNLGYRAKLYPLAIEQMAHEPIKGYGLGSFYWLFQVMHKEHYKSKTLDGTLRHTTWRRAHNDYLELAFNQGFIGLLLFLGFLFSNILIFQKNWNGMGYGLIGFTGVVTAMTNSTVHFLWHTPAILIAVFYMALMVNQTQEAKNG